MPKMFSKTKIILPDDTLVEKGVVFNATVEQAKQYDILNAARPATNEEIAAAKEAESIADGSAFAAPAPSDRVAADDKKVKAS